MQSIEILGDIEYTLGWSYCNRKHINVETSSCFPLTMFLLRSSLIDNSTSWLEALRLGLKVFDREELEGFIDGVDNQKMQLNNYKSIQKYALGYSVGKRVRLKYGE